jgi:hypothetical protein
MEGDGPTVFAHACKMVRRHYGEAEEFALPLGALARLAQNEESGARRGETGRGRGLGAMTIRY